MFWSLFNTTGQKCQPDWCGEAATYHNVLMCTVTSELAHHTQYIEAQLHNICVCMRAQIHACAKHAQTMVATQWCHQQNPEFQDWCATTWLQQSEWPSPLFLAGDSRPSVRRELQNHDGGWEADSQTGTTDLQEGCSNVDVAGAVVVALTVGQCFSALILEALLPPAPTRLIQMISLPSDNQPFIWLRRQEGGKELDWKTLQQK